MATNLPHPVTTLKRLHKAVRHDSWRTLSGAAEADLVSRGLWDADAWTITRAGQDALRAWLTSDTYRNPHHAH